MLQSGMLGLKMAALTLVVLISALATH